MMPLKRWRSQYDQAISMIKPMTGILLEQGALIVDLIQYFK
jgi:hypothetical protein